MATTEVLLLKPVDGLGGEGDQVKVRAGYARNYLLPLVTPPLTLYPSELTCRSLGTLRAVHSCRI